MLIDLFSSDLVAGYKEILTAREVLMTKWRFELLRAYTQKRERYAQQLAQKKHAKRSTNAFSHLLALSCYSSVASGRG